MGIIVNPRGAGGSGKTTLVRRVMAAYRDPAPILRPGRARPIGFRLAHPGYGHPLAIIGAYGATRGGCDTIPARDGGYCLIALKRDTPELLRLPRDPVGGGLHLPALLRLLAGRGLTRLFVEGGGVTVTLFNNMTGNGVASGAEALAKLRAGASLVQLYAGFAYDGPALIPRIKAELAALLRRDGFARVADAVGADA